MAGECHGHRSKLPIPVYFQLKTLLVEEILEGRYGPDGRTPHLAQEDLFAAGSIIAILPPLLLFAALNRFYVRGLFAGATKG